MQEEVFSKVIEQQILDKKDKFSSPVTVLALASHTHESSDTASAFYRFVRSFETRAYSFTS